MDFQDEMVKGVIVRCKNNDSEEINKLKILLSRVHDYSNINDHKRHVDQMIEELEKRKLEGEKTRKFIQESVKKSNDNSN